MKKRVVCNLQSETKHGLIIGHKNSGEILTVKFATVTKTITPTQAMARLYVLCNRVEEENVSAPVEEERF